MKEIRSKIVKESLLDYDNLAKTLKENTTSAVKDLLAETVRETYERILSEEDENEYDEEEVKDTDEKESDEKELDEADVPEDDAAEMQAPAEGPQEGAPAEGVPAEGGEGEAMAEPAPAEAGAPEADGVEDAGWAQFDKYKVSDGEYDFSKAEDEEIVKVYKLMKDTDDVIVNVDNANDQINLKDNSTGAEYLLDLGSDDNDAEGDLEIDNEMNESIIYEVALNEYDSNVGYTDNYQKKDVMTNPGMSEPGKNVNDWDAGVPKGSKKPWASKGSDKPFTEKGATKVEECGKMLNDEETIDEGAGRFGMVQKHTKAKKKIGNNKVEMEAPKVQHSDSTSEYGYKADNQGDVHENFMRKANSILRENRALKSALNKFKNVLQEAVVTNQNLGMIIKLISENSTTMDEKKEIIARFGKEATTIQESKRLYDTINNELKKKPSVSINEDRQFTANGSQQINETQIYQSTDLLSTLDLMHRICD